MALDFNAVKLLLWTKNLGASFERTVTLGHQSLDCPRHRLSQAFVNFGVSATAEDINQCLDHPLMKPLYADQFLRFLGAKETASVDYSDFEAATLIHDLNQPFPERERGRYTLVIDGGTLEHIFDYPSALRHCLELLEPGGHFLCMTPAHNHMGHGFYQFSPELFFRVFSADQGFALRKIVLYNPLKPDANFYQVHDPAQTGFRNQLISDEPMMLAVFAQRVANAPILAKPPQQSDYVAAWQRSRETANAAANPGGLLRRIRLKLNPYWPAWLRRMKANWMYRRDYGNPTLSNQRDYRLLKPEEIFSDRSRPATREQTEQVRQ